MGKVNNDNDIENVSMKHNYNVNDNGRFDRSKKVEQIADSLVEKLGNEGFRPFYCKVAYKLSEARIWQNYESAIQGNDPGRLFSWLCKRDGV